VQRTAADRAAAFPDKAGEIEVEDAKKAKKADVAEDLRGHCASPCSSNKQEKYPLEDFRQAS
jgi:hypothetical protein